MESRAAVAFSTTDWYSGDTVARVASVASVALVAAASLTRPAASFTCACWDTHTVRLGKRCGAGQTLAEGQAGTHP